MPRQPKNAQGLCNALVNIKRWHRCIEIHDPIVSKEASSHVPLVSELLYLLQANPVCTLAKMLNMTQLMTTAHMGLSENEVSPNSKGFFMFPILYQMATSHQCSCEMPGSKVFQCMESTCSSTTLNQNPYMATIDGSISALQIYGTGLLDGAGHPDDLVSREPDLSRSTGRQRPKTVTRLEARILWGKLTTENP